MSTGSELSRRKSAARAAAGPDLVRSLLRHGAQFLSPAPELVAAAAWMAKLGVITLRRRTVVRCSHRTDGDFPPPAPHCDGLIELRAVADEGGGEYRCPTCERQVYPEASGKERFEALSTALSQAGIEALLVDRLGDLVPDGTFVDGMLSVPLGHLPGQVCLVDWCREERWLGRAAGANLPIVYVTAGPDMASRMLDQEAIAHVELADILLGSKDLRLLLMARAAGVSPQLTNMDLPVYTLGTTPIRPQVVAEPARRIFHLSLSPEGLLVNGVLAIRRQRRRVAMVIIRELMTAFGSAAVSGHPVPSMTADALADVVEASDAGEGEEGEATDANNVGRTVRRLRKDIIRAVRSHKGDPIGEHDVIETVSRSGASEDAEGYRLNPKSVALGPLEP